jgi:PAS domain S-box-containing protein
MATILVVDDRVTNREVARAVLDEGGYDVIEASDGHQALASAKRNHPDVVLTDVLMPGMDGYQFVHDLRNDADTADIPVLFYTANYRTDEAQPLASTFGVSKILSKSADPTELLQAINEALQEGPEAPIVVEAGFDARHLTTVNTKLLEKVQALDESEARFAAMAEASPVGIAFGDPHGRATYVNPRLGEITHAFTAELLGHGWQRCLSDRHRTLLHGGPGGTLNIGSDGVRHQEQIFLSDGSSRWLSVLIRDLRNSERAVTGFIAMIDDVTAVVEASERRRAEELEHEREAQRQVMARFDSLARLAGGVAHDFNNMLNVIMSLDELIEEAVTDASGTLLTEPQAQAILFDVEQIRRAGQRAAHLTHQLLAFGGREIVKPVAIDVNALIKDVCDMIAGTIGRHVTIETALDPRLRHVLADASQLTQILINLAVNARDAMPEGGRLDLRTANIHAAVEGPVQGLPAGHYVHVTVADTGHGMSPDVVRQAMEPFFTTKPPGQGSGLGLATSYGAIKQAGGDFVIDSSPGKGTTMHIYLPATDQNLHAEHQIATVSANTGKTILVAEDEDGLRDAVTRHLRRAGYQVLDAPNGREALHTAERHGDSIDALLTDVVMPVMNGRELAEALQHSRPEIPVLYMSGYAAPLMTAQGVLPQGVTVLSKPFTRSELLQALDTLTNPTHEAARRPAIR